METENRQTEAPVYVYWHLPGFCVHFHLFVALAELMRRMPECFMDGYRIGSVYGTFPGAIWNGGRAVFGSIPKDTMEKILAFYDREQIPVRFTWTNPQIDEEHLADPYCNQIMQLADNGRNQVLVNAPVLEDYIRRTYPRYPLISSTTKRLTALEDMKAELDRDYMLLVLDYDMNHDESILKALEPKAGRIEILVDEICFPHCPKRSEHYQDEGRAQLAKDVSSRFPCPNRLGSTVRPSFAECMKRPAFVSREELPDYIRRGYVNFKLVGRGLPPDVVRDAILYYLVKKECRTEISKELAARMPRPKR